MRAVEKQRRWIRVFNMHSTPLRYAESLGRQLDHLLERYDPIDPRQLEATLQRGPATDQPLALFTFDDGLRNHYEVAAPELERRGARGVFCIPAVFPSLSSADQVDWFRTRVRSEPNAEHLHDEDLHAMTWDQARELVDRGHRICSHSLTHEVLNSRTPGPTLEAEIVEARKRLEDQLGSTVDGFCWPSDRDPHAADARRLVRETYGYAMLGDTRPMRKGHSPLDVYRTRIEASWPMELVDLQVSGLIDAAFIARRARSLLG